MDKWYILFTPQLQWRDRVGVSPSFPFKHETKFSCTYFPFERNLTSEYDIETNSNTIFGILSTVLK